MHDKRKTRRRVGSALIATAVLAGLRTALAAPPTQYVWSGNGGSGYFTTGANWIGGNPIPTSGNNQIVFGPRNDYGSAPFANGSYSVAGIYFNSSAAAVMVEDNPIAIGASGIEDDATNNEAILNNLVLSATQTWEIGNGSTAKLTLSGTQNLSSNALTIQCNGSSLMTANVIGSGNVYTSGTGTLTLNGSSSFSGNFYHAGAGLIVPAGASVSCGQITISTSGFNVAGGTLAGQFNIGLGASAPITATISSGNCSGNETDIGYGRAATLSQVGGTQSYTFVDVGAYNSGVALAGTGTFNLSSGLVNTGGLDVGADDANGVLHQTGGTVNASSAFIGTTHNGTATITGSGTTFNVSGPITIGSTGGATTAVLNVSSGAYSINSGQLALNSSSATVILNQPQAFYVGSLAGVAGSSIQLTNPSSGYSALEIAPSGTQSGVYRGNISGTGGISVNGSGVTEQLLGTNTYTGKTLVNQANLELATGASSYYEVDTNTLTLDFSNLGSATVFASSPGTVVYNTSSITGGILTGSGVHNTSSVTSFTGTNFASGSTIYLDTSGTSLTNTLVQGTIGAIGTTTIRGGFNLSGGTFNSSFGGLSSGAELLIDSGSATATATALVVSGTLVYNGLLIGGTGPGLLSMSGGVATGSTVVVGANDAPGGAGAFNLSGGSVSAGTPFIIGDVGPGTMTQTGGSLTAPAVFIGSYGSANGSATVSGSGSTWNITGDMGIGIALGVQANGQLTVSNGASITSVGELIVSSSGSSANISNAKLVATALSGAGTVTLADPSGNYALTINGAGDTYAGNITGTGSLLYNGSGTQVLSGTNSFTGSASVTSGTLNMATGAATTYEANGGTLILGFGSFGTSTIRDDGTAPVVFNTASVTGGTLAGQGTFNVSAVTSFSGTNISNGTTISTPSGKSLSITNGANFGTVTLNGTTTLYNWSSGGTVKINGPLSIATGNTFNQTGGTVTVAAASTVNVFGTGAINLTGGILENDGTINGPVNVTNGGNLVGTGSFSQITLGSTGGIVGNFFPGASATSPFDYYFGYITIEPAATAAAVVVSGTVNVTAAAEVSVTAAHSLQFSGNFNASGQQVFFDGGTTKLASATLGGLIIDYGIVQLTSPGKLIAGSISIISGAGSLDIGGSSLVTQSSLTSITSDVKTGYNLSGGANWSGTGGITSSVAAADPSHLTAVGVIGNNQSGSPLYTATHQFHGYTPGVNDTLVAYTYFGDANLDGKVDGSDYSLIDAGYNSHGSLTGWYHGDFNYDGVVDGSDYALIDNDFNNQSSPINPTAQVAAETAPAAVPEPASAAVIILALGRLAGRRHRRRSL
jgi:fibronectin-binding autotransporter adhesin